MSNGLAVVKSQRDLAFDSADPLSSMKPFGFPYDVVETKSKITN